MTQKEVVDTLLIRDNIEPPFTELGTLLNPLVCLLLAGYFMGLDAFYHSAYIGHFPN